MGGGEGNDSQLNRLYVQVCTRYTISLFLLFLSKVFPKYRRLPFILLSISPYSIFAYLSLHFFYSFLLSVSFLHPISLQLSVFLSSYLCSIFFSPSFLYLCLFVCPSIFSSKDRWLCHQFINASQASKCIYRASSMRCLIIHLYSIYYLYLQL